VDVSSEVNAPPAVPSRRLASPFLLVALVWAVVALPYLFRTPDTLRAHDAGAHIAYTQTLIEDQRLPTFEDTFESWQPPLYYAVMSAVAPGSDLHTTGVRLVSWLFGLGTLWCIHRNCRRLGVPELAAVLALIFLATTPKFVMYFTTYNNDAAVGFIAVAMITLFLQLRERWVTWQVAALWLLAVTAINVKLSVIVLFMAMLFVLGVDWWTRPERRRQTATLVVIGLSVPLAILPWMLLHNLPATGSLLPAYTEIPAEFALLDPTWRVLTLPGITNGEWIDPYGYSQAVDGVRWKANNYWSFLFVTSIYGEYIWSSPPAQVFWSLAWIHGTVLFVALREFGRNALTVDMGTLLVTAVLLLIAYPTVAPYTPNMDFRYIGWAWLPYTVLLASALSSRPERRVPAWLYIILGVGVALHLAVVFFPESCCW